MLPGRFFLFEVYIGKLPNDILLKISLLMPSAITFEVNKTLDGY